MHFLSEREQVQKRAENRQPLVQCSELRADEKIREAATRKLDSRILAILSRGIVAAEGHYHRLCYRDYTRKENINDSCDKIKTNNDAQYEDVVNQSNGELFFFIKNDLFTNPHVKAMAELSHKLFQSMNFYDVNHVKYSTKKYIP